MAQHSHPHTDSGVREDGGKLKLTKAQRRLLADLGEEPDMIASCAAELEWRSAKKLLALGLIELFSEPPTRAAIGHWFEAKITEAGRAALSKAEDAA